MSVYYYYESEDLNVTFGAEVERCDYGVACSPIWWELVDSSIEIDTIIILGVQFSKKEFVSKFGKEFLGFIYDRISSELPSDPEEWEQ